MSNIINRRGVIAAALAAILAANIAIYLDIPILRQVLLVTIILFLPGALALMIIGAKDLENVESIVYSVGLSLGIIMLWGFAVNQVMRYLNIPDPLNPTHIILWTNILLIGLLTAVMLTRKDLQFSLRRPSLSSADQVILIIAMTLPVAATLGAKYLNATGSNIITICMFILAAACIALIVIWRRSLSPSTLPICIFLIASAVTLQYALRSNYISGADISVEYHAFLATKDALNWQMSNFQHAYSACLSITILPTIIASLSNISDQYIFKLVFPLVYSLCPLGIYIIAKRISSPTVGFLAAVIFIVQPWFIDPMMQITRQQIGFLFFILLTATLFSGVLPRTKLILASIFSIGMVVSHYSTTYIAIGLFTGTYLLTLAITIFANSKTVRKSSKLSKLARFSVLRSRMRITPVFIAILIVASFLWYSQITHTSENIQTYATATISNLNQIFSSDLKSDIIRQVTFSTKKTPLTQTVKEYHEEKLTEYRHRHSSRVPAPEYQNYTPKIHYPEQLPVKNSTLAFTASTTFKAVILIMQALFALGLFATVIYFHDEIPAEYAILAALCILAITLIMVLPYASIGYNFDRLYLQSMVILALVAVLGGVMLFHHLRRTEIGILAVGIFAIIFFLFSSGIVWHFTGGHAPIPWLHNAGMPHEITYTHRSDVLGAQWTSSNANSNQIYTDYAGMLKLYAYSNNSYYSIHADIIPAIIAPNDKIFLAHTVVKNRATIHLYNGHHFALAFPAEYLTNKRSLLYTNSQVEVYG